MCSVTYAGAAQIGIDRLERGVFANTEDDPGRTADTCSESRGDYSLEHMSADGVEAECLIGLLLSHPCGGYSSLPSTAASASGGTLAGASTRGATDEIRTQFATGERIARTRLRGKHAP